METDLRHAKSNCSWIFRRGYVYNLGCYPERFSAVKKGTREVSLVFKFVAEASENLRTRQPLRPAGSRLCQPPKKLPQSTQSTQSNLGESGTPVPGCRTALAVPYF